MWQDCWTGRVRIWWATSHDAVARAMPVIGRIAFAVARSRASGAVVRWVFGHATGLLPVRRVHETARVIAFHHPRPAAPIHILIVPKRGVRDVLSAGERALPFVHEAVLTADDIARRLATPLTLIVNGGAKQDVPQLHLHLLSDQSDSVLERETHLILRPSEADRSVVDGGFREVIHAAQEAVARFDLARPGFSLIAFGSTAGLDLSRLHLVAGPRRAGGEA